MFFLNNFSIWISMLDLMFYFILFILWLVFIWRKKRKALCSSIKPGDRQKKSLPNAVIYGSDLIRGTTVIREWYSLAGLHSLPMQHAAAQAWEATLITWSLCVIHVHFRCCSLQVRSKQIRKTDQLAQTDHWVLFLRKDTILKLLYQIPLDCERSLQRSPVEFAAGRGQQDTVKGGAAHGASLHVSDFSLDWLNQT